VAGAPRDGAPPPGGRAACESSVDTTLSQITLKKRLWGDIDEVGARHWKMTRWKQDTDEVGARHWRVQRGCPAPSDPLLTEATR
jgi:hypothetical protein